MGQRKREGTGELGTSLCYGFLWTEQVRQGRPLRGPQTPHVVTGGRAAWLEDWEEDAKEPERGSGMTERRELKGAIP